MAKQQLTKSGFAPISIDVEANGKTCVVAIGEFKGHTYLSARFMYATKDPKVIKHSSNGINIRIDGEDGIEAANIIIEAMQHALTLTHQVMNSEVANE